MLSLVVSVFALALSVQDEPMCFTNNTSVQCRRFLEPAAVNTTLLWEDYKSNFYDFVAKEMTRDFPDIKIAKLSFPSPEEHRQSAFSGRSLRWKYGADVMSAKSTKYWISLQDDLMDLSGFFNETGLKSVLDEDSLEPCTGDDGAVLCAPISARFWWVIHSRSSFTAIDMSPPSTFRDLIESCKRFRIAGIVPIFLPANNSYPATTFWDILNIRTNGGTFHRKVSSGTVPFTDPRIIRTFENWQGMIDARCFQDDLLESALYDKRLRTLWRRKRVAMVFMGDFYRRTIRSWAVDEADIDVMPFPTVNESVVTAEIMPFDAIIVRRTTEQIRPVFRFLSSMLSRETFDILSKRTSSLRVSSRKDVALPRNSVREQGEKMLRSTDRRRNTDRRLANFHFLVPPKFLDEFTRELVEWVATSTNASSIPALLRAFEDQRQRYFVRQHEPPTITLQSGAYAPVVEIKIKASEQATRLSEQGTGPKLTILWSINEEDVTLSYTSPIKLWRPGEYVIRSKVVGEPWLDSIVTKRRFCVGDLCVRPRHDQKLWTIFICLSAVLGLCLIFTCIGLIRKIVRVFAERRQRILSERLANEQLVIDQYESTKQLNFPMAVIRADRFLALSRLDPFETVIMTAKLILLHSFAQVAVFKLSRKIVFLSHQWLGFSFPDPDNLHFDVMKNAVDRAVEMLGIESHQVYVWIDYISIPQANEKLQDMAIMSLVSYVSLCDLFIIVAPECVHSDSNIICSEATYTSRGWCRAELLARILTTGFDSMFIAHSDCDALVTFGKEGDMHSLNLFEGEFTCCSREHKSLLRCDREKLLNAFLGLYVHIIVAYKIGCSSKLDRQVSSEVLSKADELFRKSFKLRAFSNEDVTTETYSLFEDRMALCRELVELRPLLFSSSIVAITGRESVRRLTWVPGTYKILSQVSVYATPELEEQDVAAQLLSRGSTVTILTVHEAAIDGILVGQVEYPPGWIRLSNVEFSIRWVKLIDEAEDDEFESI